VALRRDDPALAGRTVLAVFAHPDDESLACGGTLARLSDAGVRVVLFCASHGERGSIGDPALVAGHSLAEVRANELREAASVLGAADVILLDHPDGDLRWAHEAQLLAQIVDAVKVYQPDVVITFAEDGLYWHLDHIGMHERTYDALESLGTSAPPLYYVTLPRGIMRNVVDAAVENHAVPPGTDLWGITPDAFGLHAAAPTLVVDVGDWVERKLSALRCHKTQIGPDSPFARIDLADARRCLGIEHFRRAPLGGQGPSILELIGQPTRSS
jgi:LmbE family N-acetylglucosaminyl deacetylase